MDSLLPKKRRENNIILFCGLIETLLKSLHRLNIRIELEKWIVNYWHIKKLKSVNEFENELNVNLELIN